MNELKVTGWPDTAEGLATYLQTRRNWGRWGADDQLGALNLITDEKRLEATRLVRKGRAVSLSRPVPSAPAANNPHPALHFTSHTTRPTGAGVATDFQGMAYHGQAATHIDALCHVWGPDGLWGGRPAEDVISSDGASWGSIEHWSGGILTRGVVIDIPRFRKTRYVTQDRPVTGRELAAAAESQGVSIEPGDAIAIHCGRDDYELEHGPWSSDFSERPGLDASCLPFFRETDCAVVLWDMWDTNPDTFGLPFGVHSAIFAFGIAVVDAAALSPLIALCEEEGRSDFMLTVNPTNVVGGTGSLVNPVAVL